MKRSWMKCAFGVGLLLSGCLVAGSVHAQQVIDLFDGKADVPEGEPVMIEGVSSHQPANQAPESSLQIERGGGSTLGTSHGGQALRLPFERFGTIIRVKAKVQGRTVYFLLDTGATYSTLTPAFAKELGLTPAPGNPKTMSQTANGMVERTFGLIPRLELGDRMHTRVSFTLCESCGSDVGEHPSVGLLGLNVLRRYRMTIDDQRGIVELVPQGEFANQRDDITPWLDIGFQEKLVSDGKVNRTGHVLKVKNLSGHAVQSVEISWSCEVVGGEAFEEILTVPRLAARGSSEVRLPLPPPNCQNHQMRLQRAQW